LDGSSIWSDREGSRRISTFALCGC
jgi:hypothetical protein